MKKPQALLKYRFRQLLLLSVTFTIFYSCSSVDQTISKGNYDEAVNNLTVQLQKNDSPRKIEQLSAAYNLANNRNLDSIVSLKKSGQPDIWHQVYSHYMELQTRQNNVSVLPAEILEKINFTPVDYSTDIEASRAKAAEYHYALARKKMSEAGDELTFEAYNELQKVQNIFPGFRDVEQLMEKYREAMPVMISYQIENDYPLSLPPGMERQLESIGLSKYNTPKYQFYNARPQDQFEVFVLITVRGVKISPEKTGELAYTESVEMQDGVAYRLNDEGGFELDSAGRKIEIPKLKTLVCYVNEFKQEKSMLLTGTVEIFHRASGQKLTENTVKGEYRFSNVYAKFKGDMDALSPETFALVGSKKLDFPPDDTMIMKAGEKLAQEAAKKTLAVLKSVKPL
jgi:hypothetical protein